jgi:hypothetical protein
MATTCSASRRTFASYSLLFVVLMPAAAMAQDISDEWQFAATLYVWLPDIAVDSTFPEGSGSSIEVSLLDYLKMAGLGSFNVQKARWGGFTDLIYLDLGTSRSRGRDISVGGQPLPANVTAATESDFRTTFWLLGGSYRVAASPDTSVDVLAGARLAHFKMTLGWQLTGSFGAISPQTGRGDASFDQWDAIVGVKGRYAFGDARQWVVPFYIDLGTGDSEFTWQAMLGLSYAFGWGDVNIAWRYLDYDLKSGSPILNANFNGPAFGVTFRW